MKEQEAVDMLTHLLRWSIKAPSSVMEALEQASDPGTSDEIIEAMAADMYPWLFGKSAVSVALDHLLGRVRNGQILTPGDFYNMMIIVDKTDVLKLCPIAFDMGWKFPKPSLKIFTEWEPTPREGVELDDEYDPLTDPGYMMGLLAKRKAEHDGTDES